MAECLYDLPVPIVFVVRYNEVVHICSPCIGVVTSGQPCLEEFVKANYSYSFHCTAEPTSQGYSPILRLLN